MFSRQMRQWIGAKSVLALLMLALVAACSNQKEVVRSATQIVPDVMTADPEWRARLEEMAKGLEEQRVKNHVPGMALAVVKGDEIIFARGFGMADLEHKIPAHPGTLFAIGSATKAFTSTLVAMMVEEGKMQWDDPIEKHLPYLKLQVDSDKEGDSITVRDMLSHRSGFTRMGILWVGGNNSRETVLKAATKAKPWDGYRNGFHYTNVMYIGAGVAAGEASGSDWDQLLRERLFTPLGMKHSSSTYAAAQTNPAMASGYRWDTEKETIMPLPMRNIDSVGPAGSINANVLDMAHWLRFQLGTGAFEGKRLVAAEHLLETRKPQMEVGGGAQYGLGWFLQELNGRKLVFHGGNIDGFAAMVGLAPDQDLGFVLLTNTTSNPLQNASVGYVFDQLLGDREASASSGDGASDADNFDTYFGEYSADFGPFQNEYLKVLEQNGKLAVDVPRQTIYELHPANEEGKWVFTMTDTIAVSFEKNESGVVTLMRLHQNGFDFELPRKGFPIEPEIDPSELNKFLGKFYSEKNKKYVDVVIKNHRLGLKMNDRLTLELRLPDENGHRYSRARAGNSVVFNTSEDGEVVSMSGYRNGELRETLKRVEDENKPTMAAIDALRGGDKTKAALGDLGVLKLTGTISFTHAGVSGAMSFTADGSKRYLLAWDLGSFGNSRTGTTPDYAATASSFSPFEEHVGRYLEQMRKGHLGISYLDWRDLYQNSQVLGNDKLDDKEVYKVRLSGGKTPATVLFLDPENGDVLKQDATLLHPLMGRIEATVYYSDYRETKGVRIPFEIKISQQHIGELVYRFEKIETNLEPDPAIFVVKEPGK